VVRARCQVIAVAPQGWAGTPVAIDVVTSTAVELSHGTDRATSGPGRRCRLEVTPAHRGVATDVTVTLASAAPFGFLWWERKIVLTLPTPLAVAPSMVAAGALHGTRSDGVPGDMGAVGAEQREEPRGVRPYAPGDRFNHVHWPASAHTGGLMIRETERPTGRPHTVVVELPDEPIAAELLAQRYLGAVARMLAAGERVDLVTVEPSGPVRAPVSSPDEVGRRLANCLPRWPPWGTRWPA
jgi:uncharacterized protein (DUF58 family)